MITAELSEGFKKDGMLAYVNLVQKREKELGVDVLTHQRWSGAAYVDGILGAIQSGSSVTKTMGDGNTESGKSNTSLAFFFFLIALRKLLTAQLHTGF